MPRRNAILTVAVLALVVLAGCSGAGGGGSGGDVGLSNDGDGAERAEAGDGGGDGGGSGGDSAASQSADSSTSNQAGSIAAGRALVRTGTVHLEVDDHDAARSDIASMARNRGGFVAESSETVHSRGNQSWTTGRLVVRVPSESFGDSFDDIKARGSVLNAESRTVDVTDQLVDLEARLSNLRAERERLRTLYERANDTEDVLRVGERLSSVQEQIERLEAQKRSLEDRVAYSTITIELREPEPERESPEPRPQYHETPLYQAFTASIGGVVVAFKTAAVTLAYALPYLVVVGLPLGVAGAAVYRRR